jgi:hypothetical protein
MSGRQLKLGGAFDRINIAVTVPSEFALFAEGPEPGAAEPLSVQAV